jgi:dihydroflavonol-4-reductase
MKGSGMTRIFVTGANGHIGSNTVRSLLQRGYDVIPFVRSTSDLRGIEKLGLSYQFGDIMDYSSLQTASKGCDAIIHHAGVYRIWAKNPDDIIQPALEGTKNIFKAAKENGIRRMVYTSSIAAVGSLREPVGRRTESDWNENTTLPYIFAKTQSEREALQLSEEYDIPTIRLCPTFVIGPYDYRITPTTNEILGLINKTGPTYEAGRNYVHVHDVGEVHAMAIDKGEPGRRYIVGGDNIHMKELSALVTDLTGVKPNHLGVTGPLADLLGAIVGSISSIGGKEPVMNREIVHNVFGWYSYFDCGLTNQTFGISPRGVTEALKDTIRWLLFLGKIKPEVAERISPRFQPDPDW